MAEEENCKDGNPHDWKITEDDKWTDTSVEKGKNGTWGMGIS